MADQNPPPPPPDPMAAIMQMMQAMQTQTQQIQAQLLEQGRALQNLQHHQERPQHREAQRPNPPRRNWEEGPRNNGHPNHAPKRPNPEPPDPIRQKTHSTSYMPPSPFYFTGTRDPEEYLAWEARMEYLFAHHNYSNSSKLTMAVSYLCDDAEAWWFKEASKRRRFDYPQISSWEVMKLHLRKRYVPSHVPEHIMRYSTRPHISQAPSQPRVTKQVEPFQSPTAQVPPHFYQPVLTHSFTNFNHLSRPEVSTTCPEKIPSATRKTFTKDHPKADAVQQPITDNITVPQATVVAVVPTQEADDTKESLAHATSGDTTPQTIHAVPPKEDNALTLSKPNHYPEPGQCLNPCGKAVAPLHINDAGKRRLALKLLGREGQNIDPPPDSKGGVLLQRNAYLLENNTSILRAPRNELDHKFNPEPYNKWKPKEPQDSVPYFPTPKVNVYFNQLIFNEQTTVIMHFFLPLSVRAGTGNKALDQQHHDDLYKEIMIKSPTKADQLVTEAKQVKEKPPDPSKMEVTHFKQDKKVKEKPPDTSTTEDTQIKEKPPDPSPQHQQPNHILAPGKTLNPHSIPDTNLLPLHAEGKVLRTKPPEEGGNDEDIRRLIDQLEHRECIQGSVSQFHKSRAKKPPDKDLVTIPALKHHQDGTQDSGHPMVLKEDSETHLFPGDGDNHTGVHLKTKEPD